jgi:hypothetical protein
MHGWVHLIHCGTSVPDGEDAQGEKMQDGIRRGLGYAMQWYDSARLALEDKLDSAVRDGARSASEKGTPSGETVAGMGVDTDITMRKQDDQVSGLPGQCAELLQKRCPACFGGKSYGRPLSE